MAVYVNFAESISFRFNLAAFARPVYYYFAIMLIRKKYQV